jgi:YVTN family beta-propeller protein
MRGLRSVAAAAGLACICIAVAASSASAAAVVKTIPVGPAPEGVSSDGTHVWVANFGGNTVSEIDASTGTVVNTIPVGSEPEGVSSDGTHVWVANGGGTVSEIDGSTGTLVKTIPVGSVPLGVSSDGTHVWVTNSIGNTVSEIDASTGTLVNTITLGSGPYGVSSDGTHVWVANSNGGTVSEIDGSTGTVVKTIPVGSEPVGVSSDGNHAWVTNEGGTVSEIDASTGTVVKTIKVGSDSQGVSSDGRHVWVENARDLSEIDASTGTVVNTIPVGSGIHAEPFEVSSDGTHVWVTYSGGTVSEIQISSASTLPVPPPVLGKSVDAAPVSGVVLLKQRGKRKFVRLRAGQRIPLGSTIDTTHGRVQLTSAKDKAGHTTTGVFYAGVFRLTQVPSQGAEITVLTLAGPKPSGCSAVGSATVARRHSRKRVRKRSLWGNSKGDFRTKGTYASASERGTRWLTQDTCAGTLIHVAQGEVTVDDLPHHRTFLLKAPHSFLAHRGKGG